MHIVFVDSNLVGLETIDYAKRLGHNVSFIRGPLLLFKETQDIRAIIDSLDTVLDVKSSSDPVEVQRALESVNEQNKIDVVLSLHEFATEATAIAAKALGLKSTNPEAVVNARRKAQCREILDKAGIPSARYGLANNVQDALKLLDNVGYPAIAKPPSGGDSLLAFTIYSKEDATEKLTQILNYSDSIPEEWHCFFNRGILIEQKLEGNLVSVELGVWDSNYHSFCISGRFRWADDETVELGSYIPAQMSSNEEEECIEYAKKVCEALGLDLGIFHIEVMYTNDGPRLIEVNPRLMGGGLPLIYKTAKGKSISGALIDIFTGNTDNLVFDYAAPTDACAAGRKIMPLNDATLPSHIDLEWIKGYEGVIQFDNYKISPDTAVKAGDLIGRMILIDNQYDDVVAKAHELLEKLENALDMPLQKFEYSKY
ncbi:ATP-grasp domain-containing protein [Vibrio parahaemolyticus]|uniref:ATP-grasp domain-containing protein n=1 Tax=Vibrio parahaemolyticus TaxID=670 RepID=UPI0006A6112D|nr:ATP-grasp domain-containing protein [Vibrio parahaemolyticus]EHD6028065.1 ATP-grasp domain-containing protein [Vibrio parahaemolyticus]EJR0956380.1 ATP-grasp domain-containing protein [Vibrio parahaemolyticus]EKY4207214.1 ATP-grasp domain-containing protein [Vibrio parahaemolyticus]EMA9658585.1 ATP-grasp domain-containing protein [Vibrio parahaemolyticus]KOE96933.1 hypothetical protein ACS88_01925 [Vibrio parahaemolyticus]